MQKQEIVVRNTGTFVTHTKARNAGWFILGGNIMWLNQKCLRKEREIKRNLSQTRTVESCQSCLSGPS